METKHRIKVKIGASEFEAEGNQELVKKQFGEFMAAVSQLSAQSSTPPPKHGNDADKLPPNIPIPRDVLSRVFRSDEPFSLLAKPRTDNVDADGLIVLLYGMSVLKAEQTVTGLSLMKSAKQSGLKLKADRIDRTLETYIGQLVNSAGKKRGLRYSLNNRGIAEAERLIREMVK